MDPEVQNQPAAEETPAVTIESSQQLAAELMDKEIPAPQKPEEETGTPPVKTEPEKTTTTPPASTTTPPATTPGEVTYFSGKYNDLFKMIKSKGLDIDADEVIKSGKLPPNVTEEEFVAQLIADATETEGAGDPFIENYLAAKSQGKVIEFMKDAINIMNFQNMPADEGLRFTLQSRTNEKGERKYTDEQINKYLEKLTDIEKDNLWETERGSLQQQLGAKTKDQEVNEEKEWNAFLTKREEHLGTLLAKEETLTTFNGVEYTPELKADFTKFMKDITQITEKGRTKWSEMLDNDQVFLEIARAWFFTKSDLVKNTLSNLKEDIKAEVLDKTGLRPKATAGQEASLATPPTASDFL